MRRHKELFINLNQVKILARNVSIVLLFLLALFFMLLNKTNEKSLAVAEGQAVGLLGPVIRVLTLPAKGIYGVCAFLRDVSGVYTQNQQLKEENRQLREKQNRYKALESENVLLGRLLNYSAPEEAKLITAQIIAEGSTGFSHSVIAYIGDAAGIKPGQIALNETGVVGRVESVGRNYARIMLITDINSKIPVIVERNRIRGILSGDNTVNPKLIFVPLDVELEVGDMLITSGVAGGFPAGLPVGTIYEIEDNRIKIQPLADLDRLEYIQIVDYGLNIEPLDEESEQ